jgi:hypothetical protein
MRDGCIKAELRNELLRNELHRLGAIKGLGYAYSKEKMGLVE